MSDPALLTGPRSPRWTFELLNSSDEPIGVIDGVKNPSFEIAATERLGGSAKISIDDRDQGIDWLSHRVRASYDPGTGYPAWPIGVYLLTSPVMGSAGGRRSWQVGLLTKMVVVDGDQFDETFSVAAGTPIVPLVSQIIMSTGEQRITATDTGKTTSVAMAWDAGTSKLTIINDLLEAAGYWALWCDRAGRFRVEPYVDPSSRQPAWVFAAGPASTGGASLHRPKWSREQDLASIPNQVVCSTQGSDETPAIVGVARNDNPDSPFSVVSRGRVISASYAIEAESQAVADQIAQRRLLDAMSPVAKLEVEHALVPLEANDLVVFRPAGGVDGRESVRATVQRMQIDGGFDGHVSATWREVLE